MFRLKCASALLVAVLAISSSADQARAWHCLGSHHYGYAYSSYYSPVYASAYSYGYSSYYRPYAASYSAYYRPAYSGCCSYYTPAFRHCRSYYTPAYRRCGSYYTPAYRRCCGSYALGWSYGTSYHGMSSGCCNSVAPAYDYVSPSPTIESAPAEPQTYPAEPLSTEPQPNSVLRTPTPPEPTDVPPSLPPVPDAITPPVPDAITPPVPDAITPPAPAPGPALEPTPALPLLPDGSTRRVQPIDSTILSVQVPEDARVYVNGMLTKTPGTTRQYLSRGLEPGHRYTYEVRAEVTRNGRRYSNSRTVHVRAGETNQVAFQIDPRFTPTIAATETATSLVLNVPATAKVSLEGRTTDATGTVRTFTTQELAKDQRWENYNVVVELEQNGRLERREKSISLIGGQSHELTFDFQPPQVASR